MLTYWHLRLAATGLVLTGYSGHAQIVSNSDPVIEQARKATADYVQALPKYLVQRTTRVRLRSALTRLLTPVAAFRVAPLPTPADTWRTLDVVTADIVIDHGHAVDLNLKVNGAAATEADVNRAGSWAEGDFDGALQAIFSQESAGTFTKKRSVTLAKRSAWRYGYSVEQVHSDWHLSHTTMDGTFNYAPAFGGAIWIDQETSRVLRFEMEARNLPDKFSLNKVQWAIDYDLVKVGSGNYLLPKHSQIDNCQRKVDRCTRNVTDFQNYKEYSADTNISFDEDK